MRRSCRACGPPVGRPFALNRRVAFVVLVVGGAAVRGQQQACGDESEQNPGSQTGSQCEDLLNHNRAPYSNEIFTVGAGRQQTSACLNRLEGRCSAVLRQIKRCFQSGREEVPRNASTTRTTLPGLRTSMIVPAFEKSGKPHYTFRTVRVKRTERSLLYPIDSPARCWG